MFRLADGTFCAALGGVNGGRMASLVTVASAPRNGRPNAPNLPTPTPAVNRVDEVVDDEPEA